MLVTPPRVHLGRFWQKPAAGGLVVASALLLFVLSPATAMAMSPQASKSAPQAAGQEIPAAGHIKATLLAPQSKHEAPPKHAKPLRSMNPSALKEAKRKADAEAAQSAPGSPPTAPAAAPAAALFNGLNQPGLSAADEGSGATPPDSTGAIGPTRYVEMVNQLVGVYDRSNLALLSSEDLATFVGAPVGIATTDPQIQWDPQANRWLYAEIGFATGNNMLVFGWSKTADPSDLTNGWCHYGVGTGSSLQDYPKLGHDANFLVVGTNVYDDRTGSFPFVTANIWAIPKPAANDFTCSSPVTATYFADATHVLKNSDGTLAFTPVPANSADSVVNDPIFGAHDATLAPQKKVMEWHMESHPNPVLVADGDISVGTFAIPPSIPQPGTGYLIDSLDGRLTQAVAHFDPSAGAEAVWTQQTIAGSGRSVVRWYEFLPASRSIYQQGVLQNSSDFYFNAAISPTSAGNEAAIFYNRASSTLLSKLGSQTRTGATPLGQMDSGELSLGSSMAANQENAFSTNCTQNPCRWGDYSGASPDPAATHVVWGSNQLDGPVFYGYAQWFTQNFAVSTVPPVPDFSLTVSPVSQTVLVGAGTSFTVNIAAVNGFTSAVSLSVSGLPTGAAGAFSPNPAPGATSTLSVTTGSSTPTGTYPLTITGSGGGLSRTAAATLVVKVPPPDFSMSVSPSSQTINQGGGTSYSITITPLAGFNGAVSLSAGGLPSGSTAVFSPNPASASSTLAVTTASGAQPGYYTLTVTGTSGSLTRTASATLAVNGPAPCASASISPASTTQGLGSTVSFVASSAICSKPQYQYWVQYLDGSWNMLRAFSIDPTWAWNTSGLAPGTYTVHVWANQVGDSTALGEAIGSSSVTLNGGCTSAAISPASTTASTGGIVNFTATSGGCSNPQYQYWVQYLDGSWNMLRAFSTDPTWTWNTSGRAPGTYTVHVWANQVGASTALGEAIGSSTVTLNGGCTSAAISPASTTASTGGIVNFTASSGGCSNPQYQYWVQYLDGSWNMLRAFSTDPTWAWNTSGRAPGTYTVHVWANQVGDSTALGEAIGSSTVTLTGGCTSASIAASPMTPQPVGSVFKFTASSSGCSNPQYQYWVQYLDGSWNMLRAFSTDPTWSWNTAGLAPGTYNVHVWANQVGDSTALGEAIGATTATLTGACVSASIATSPSTTMLVTSTFTFTATSSGCSNPQYQYWVQYLDGSWNMLRAFSTSPTWSWSTAGMKPGAYAVHVWANQVGDSTALGEAIGATSVTLTGCSSASLTPSTGSVAAGTTVTFTASSTGCPNPIYEFWLQDTSGSWNIMQGFSTSNTWQWNTTALPKGTYNIHVWANQQGADTSAFDGNGASTFTLT